MLSLGSNNVEGCNGVPYPTTAGAKADIGPGYNGTLPSGSSACYSSPNALGSLCCEQIRGQAYECQRLANPEMCAQRCDCTTSQRHRSAHRPRRALYLIVKNGYPLSRYDDGSIDF
ncbi:hypothetical protein CspeluHIS016_0114050 [Cutaneotrichosporon spelunceum]|uniref:Uncharacterized protein n=1 Tax=Cutaneotrichosporon spelunceum TaxID=1672016 RepID=A0AAD3YAK7_9TREE|nr:hypothetical protein CspeluHIS016_0114050 [Cutaneotrichosporon spelunceum]